MKFCITTLAAIVVLSIFALDSASAKGAKGGKVKPTPVPSKVNAAGTHIQMVSGDSVTIEYSKTSTTYKITAETQIDIDGKRARAMDLRPGMPAEVDVSKINPNLLLSIKAHALPKS